jgi:hypothetical protein
MHGKRLLCGLAMLLLAGCGGLRHPSAEPGQNFLTYTYPFTDKAAADALASARQICLKRGRAVLQTSKACSLEQCTANFQCVDSAEASKGGS